MNYVDVQSWARISFVDKTNVYLMTAWLLKIPHVGCFNHKFNFGHDIYH